MKKTFTLKRLMPFAVLLAFAATVTALFDTFVNNYTDITYLICSVVMLLEVFFMSFCLLKNKGETTKKSILKSLISLVIGAALFFAVIYYLDNIVSYGSAVSVTVSTLLVAVVLFVPFVMNISSLKKDGMGIKLISLLMTAVSVGIMAFAFVSIPGKEVKHYGRILPAVFSKDDKANFTEWSDSNAFTEDATITLEKASDKDFVILNLTDIQLSQGDMETDTQKIAFKTVEKLIDEVKPDLITLTGDNAWDDEAYVATVDFIDSFGIPWAPVMGNHDGEGCFSELFPAFLLASAKNCLFKFGPEDMGYGNYIINIKENGKTIHTLFMLDTHGSVRCVIDGERTSVYDHLWDNQIDYYKWAVKGIKAQEGKTVESTVFFHIPTVQYFQAWNEVCGEFGEETGRKPESYGEEIKTADGHTVVALWGERNEAGGQPPTDNGFFDVVKEMGSTKTILAGHDHVDDYAVIYDGITLAYSVKTGPGAYWNEDMNGGTVVTINSDGKTTLENRYVASDGN